MSLVIELPKEMEAALASEASAARSPTERYLAEIIQDALKRHQQRLVMNLKGSLDDLAASVPPETTREDMEAALDKALTAVRQHRAWPQ